MKRQTLNNHWHFRPQSAILRAIAALLLLLLPAWSWAAPQTTPAQDEPLRVGIGTDLNPYAFTDSNGIPMGYVPDLFHEIARHEDRQVSFYVGSPGQLVAAILNREFDVAALVLPAGADPRFAASRPLAEIEFALFTTPQLATAIDPSDLSGRRIALEFGSRPAGMLAERSAVEPHWVANLTQGFALLAQGEVEAFFAPRLAARTHLVAHHQHQVEPVAGSELSSPLVLVTHPSRADLIEQLDAALVELEHSGQLETLHQRWLEEPLETGAWWQQHLSQVTLTFGVLLLLTLSLMIWTVTLLKKYRGKSYLLEQSLEITGELVADLDQQRRDADLYLQISEAMVIGLDLDARITLVNQRACSLLECRRDDLIGRDWLENFILPQDRDRVREIFKSLLTGEDEHYASVDAEIQTCSGAIRSIQWHNRVQRDSSGSVVGTLSSGIDITQRIEALNELAESRERYKTLFTQFESLLHGISEPLLIISRNLEILWANKAAWHDQLLSESIRAGQPCNTIEICRQLCDETCIINRCLERNEEIVHKYYHSSGRSLKIRVFPASSDDGQPQSVILMAQDITEVLKARTEIARASQLASIGELAANVAHEINNPLHGIINYADILKTRADDAEFTRDIVTRISNEGERISGIVKNLLDYTRNKNERPGPVALPMVIQSADMLLGHKLKTKSIAVEHDIPADLPLLKGCSSQLQQVFINLLGNAHDALLDKEFATDGQRRIRISASAIDDMIEVCCEDNGSGMSEEALQRAFESFYTTKPPGKGTGLGLSISKSIVEEHGGAMAIESAEGEWTRVRFTVPRFRQSDITNPAAEPPSG